jgi:PAS domain S-box-containing protein
MTTSSPGEIRVLHVEDDPEFADLTSLYLERERDAVTVVTASDASDGLDRLTAGDVDCVVSDYNMPGMNGIEFLERVREEHPDLPFVLFTGRGSEEVASDAISAGVTGYLQKEGGTDQYKVLANQIENAVAQYRAERKLEETTRWYSTILEHSSDYVMIVDGNGAVSYVSPAIERVMGYEPGEMEGANSFEFVHPEDAEAAATTMAGVIENPDEELTTEFRAQHADGSWRWLETRGRNLLDDPVIEGVMVNVRDITERKSREQDLQRQKDRLEKVSSFISHDVRNQLGVIEGRIELAQADAESEHLDAAMEAANRIGGMIDKVMEFARAGQLSVECTSVGLGDVARSCWRNVMEEDASLVVASDAALTVNEERFRSLLVNLFLNSVEHGGDDVTVRVGALPDGFYVEDDGVGIPSDVTEHVFDSGFSTTTGGTGLGLAIVADAADTHDWVVSVTESDDGGARFEFSDVNAEQGTGSA